MKAIFKRIINKKKTSYSILKYCLTLKPVRGKIMPEDIGARVGLVMSSEDLGIDTKNFKELNEHSIKKVSKLIDQVSRTNCKRKGKNFNHWVISAAVGESHEEFSKRFEQATKDLFKQLGGGRYVAIQHVDGEHPHGHIIADNFDRVKSIGSPQGCRRSFKRTNGTCTLTLGELNRMDFTEHFKDARKYKNKEEKEKWVTPKVKPTKSKELFTIELLKLLKKIEPRNLPSELFGWKKVVRRGVAVSYKRGKERVSLKNIKKERSKEIEKDTNKPLTLMGFVDDPNEEQSINTPNKRKKHRRKAKSLPDL